MLAIMKHSMNKIAAVVVAFCSACLLSLAGWAQTSAAKPNLATADWSVKSAHNLASNSPPADAVWAFVSGPFRNGFGHVCDFRFADLRHSGNLSLVVVIDVGATAGCEGTEIFDKTSSGFEHYSTFANSTENLRDSIQDIKHDGNLELVLYGPLAPSESRRLGCDAEWPMIFAWRGGGYTEVSSQYKGYYEQHLKSLKKQIAASSSGAEEAQAPAAGQTPAPQPAMVPVPPAGSFANSSNDHSMGGGALFPAPAASSSPAAAPAPTPDSDYDCERVEAAKTEAFLGIHSDATMSDAIKASENSDPNERVRAAVILSYIGTPEAMADLKDLAADSDPVVAKLAKARLSYGQEPDEYYRQVNEEPVELNRPPIKHRTSAGS